MLEAENGVTAIALACAHLPDLMILDAVMPQMGGFEAIAAIRSRPGLSTTPAIVVSGLEDVEARVNALAIGADDFIVKPFDHRELLARVRAQLRVVDAWHGRLSTMTSDFREIRRRITESARVTSPTDTARSLQAQFPQELGCSTLLIVDSTGHHEWARQPFYPEDIVELDLLDPATRPGNTTAGGENSGSLPAVRGRDRRHPADTRCRLVGQWTGSPRARLCGPTGFGDPGARRRSGRGVQDGVQRTYA